MLLALGFLVNSAFWPGVAMAATTPRWAILGLVPWLVNEQRPVLAHVYLLLFIAWAALTLFWSTLDGPEAVLQLCLLAGCFALGNQTIDLEPLWIGAGLALWVSSALACMQQIGFRPVPIINPSIPAGLFLNGPFLAEAAAVVTVGVVVSRIWWLLPGLLPALLLPQSRGALLACAVALGLHYRGHAKAVLCVALLALATLLVMSRGLGLETVWDRMQIYEAASRALTFFGHGAGSTWLIYPQYDVRLGAAGMPEHLHNEFLEVTFELGLVGLAIFALFCFELRGPLDTARLALVAIGVESLTGFPLHQPATGFIGMVVAGHAVRSRPLLRCLLVGRRGAKPAGNDNARPRPRRFQSRPGDEDISLCSPLPRISFDLASGARTA